MRSLPLIIVVGGDDLALRVCEELCATRDREVVVLWDPDASVARRVERCGGTFAGRNPVAYESLQQIGVADAAVIMPVSEDDRLNLRVALQARDLNPQIRIVLRQFNRALGRKIEQNLPNCTAISPAAHAAATYAAAAVDPGCRYGLQFPHIDGPLLAFSERTAREFGLRPVTIAEAERRIGARIITVDDRVAPSTQRIGRDDRVVAFGPANNLQHARLHRRAHEGATPGRKRRRDWLLDIVTASARLEPLAFYAAAAGFVIYIACCVYFMLQMHLTFVEAMYFTAQTMVTVGYGDITPLQRHAGTTAILVSIAAMLAGVTIGGILIATVASALSRAQETALHGVRQIHAQDHVVVCGAGNVGTRVIDFLLRMDVRVVVIERNPSAFLLELARTRRVDLLRADTTNDDTLILCSLPAAQSLVAVTDSDTANLEAALGARVQSPELPVVLRIKDAEYARSIANNFTIAKSFSASELTAPAIAGLVRFRGSRGRVTLGDTTYTIDERATGTELPAEHAIPLHAWRGGELVPIHDFSEERPGDRVIYIVPLAPPP